MASSAMRYGELAVFMARSSGGSTLTRVAGGNGLNAIQTVTYSRSAYTAASGAAKQGLAQKILNSAVGGFVSGVTFPLGQEVTCQVAGFLGVNLQACQQSAGSGTPASFTGGQCVGVLYRVWIQYPGYEGRPDERSPDDPQGNIDGPWTMQGPILGIRKNYPFNAFIQYGNGQEYSIGGGSEEWRQGVIISRVERVDGQADNCGNPPGGYAPSTGLSRSDLDALRESLERLLDEREPTVPGDEDGDGINDELERRLQELEDLIRDILDQLQDDEEDGDEDEEDEEENPTCQGKNRLARLIAVVERIYHGLGLDLFGGDKCNPRGGEYELTPESLMRTWASNAYEVSVGGQGAVTINPRAAKVKNLPELLAALLSVPYIRSGQWRYPSNVLNTLIKTEDQALTQLFPQNETRPLVDQQDYHQWFLEQWDAAEGQWMQKIVIEDADLEQEGDQRLEVTLPNKAEALAELYLLVYDLKMTCDTLLNFNSRLAIEQACIKAEVLQAKEISDTVLTYLGCQTKEVKRDMPLLFTLTSSDGETPSEANLKDKNNLAKLLEASLKPIVLTQLAEKGNLQVDLNVFRLTCAIIRGSQTRSFGKGDNLAQKLVDMIKLADSLIGGDGTDGPDDDFTAFINQVELGFTGASGVSDSANPYGRPFDQRPQIRQIGDRPQEDS